MQLKVQIFLATLFLTSFAHASGAGININALTHADVTKMQLDKKKVELGKMLYFDPRLSVDGTVSCQSCHNAHSNGSDHRPHSIGVKGQAGDRKAPTVWNAVFMSSMFWDGRAGTLEEQATGPILNPIEMGMPNAKAVEDRLKSIPEYQKLFAGAFGSSKEPVTLANVGKAIAEFERTLVTPDSPFDQFLAGKKNAINESAKKGWELVQSVGCTTCHMGKNFAGPQIPQGTPFLQKFPTFAGSAYDAKYNLMKDEGRAKTTKKAEDKHMWRVPTWRNVALTAPYFHNGSVNSLDEAVKVMAKTQLNRDLKDDEVKNIVAFLNSLTGKRPLVVGPQLPQKLSEATPL